MSRSELIKAVIEKYKLDGMDNSAIDQVVHTVCDTILAKIANERYEIQHREHAYDTFLNSTTTEAMLMGLDIVTRLIKK